MMKKFGIVLTASLLVLGMVSCKDYVGKEKSHPLFVKAGQAKQSGQAKEAAGYFRDFLDECPKSSLAHYELASLYNDDLDEPLKALYHYERCLELAPDSSDAENVRTFAEAARKKAFEKLSQIYPSKEKEEAKAKADLYYRKMMEYVEYSKKLQEINRKQLQIIRSGKVVKNVPPKKVTTPPAENSKNGNTDEKKMSPTDGKVTTPAGKKKTAPTDEKVTVPAAGKQRIYVVKPGDTLSKISRQFYGTTKYHTLLRNANKLTRNNLWVGQKLVIPPLAQER